jgi:hypothetical protein
VIEIAATSESSQSIEGRDHSRYAFGRKDISPCRAGVFICYRREESAFAARAIHDRIAQRLERENVFLDVDNIDLGVDWFTVLTERVGACDALIAVMGRNWVSIADTEGRRRLDDPDDFVRIEIEAALLRDVRVIPVLVDGAAMPKASQLPESLKGLARRQGTEVSPVRFEADVEKLTHSLVSILDERRRRDAAEAEAARVADDQRRVQETAAAERAAREEQKQQEAAEAVRAEEAQRLAAAEAARRAEEERQARQTEEGERAAREERERREAAEAARAEEARRLAEAEAARRAEEVRRAQEAAEAERVAGDERGRREAAATEKVRPIEEVRERREAVEATRKVEEARGSEAEHAAYAVRERLAAAESAEKAEAERRPKEATEAERIARDLTHKQSSKEAAERALPKARAEAVSSIEREATATADDPTEGVARLPEPTPRALPAAAKNWRLVAVIASAVILVTIVVWLVSIGPRKETGPLPAIPPSSANNKLPAGLPSSATSSTIPSTAPSENTQEAKPDERATSVPNGLGSTKRELFNIDRVTFSPPKDMDAIMNAAKDDTSIEQIIDVLRGLKINFNRDYTKLDSNNMPKAMVSALDDRKPDDIFLIRRKIAPLISKLFRQNKPPIDVNLTDRVDSW